jgi:hypothetical protein
MTVSAFGVEHDRDDVYKALRFPGGGKGAKTERAREMLGRAVDTARTATGRALADPKNKDLTLRKMPEAVGRQAAADSPMPDLLPAAEKVAQRRSAAKAAGTSTSLLDNVTAADLVHGGTFRRTEVKPENLFRGKKTTTTTSNPLTGRNRVSVEREGNTFFKPKHTIRENGGEAQTVDDKAGGLTGKGKVAFVGGPGAAAGLGGIALNEKSKRNAYGY